MIRYSSAKQQTLPGFESPFEQGLDARNRWVKLAEVIPWDELVDAYSSRMSSGHGRPAKSPRLVIGAMIIKHRQRWTDEETVEQIRENPYLQYFCGFTSFKLEQPFAPSLFVEVRRRMGGEVFEAFEQAVQGKLEQIIKARQESAKAAIAEQEPVDGGDDDEPPESPPGGEEEIEQSKEEQEEEEPNPQGKLIMDATVSEQAIRYPTDLGTLNEAREISEALIDRLYPMSGLQKKPRTYRQKARQDFLALTKKRNPRRKKLRRGIKQQLQYLRRNLGHIEMLLECHAPRYALFLGGYAPLAEKVHPDCLRYRHLRQYWVIQTVYAQQKEMYDKESRRCDDRIVSISQPHIRPIVRGKAGKKVEFGAKLSASLDGNGLARVDELRWDAFNESEDLPDQVEAYKKRHGHYPEVVLADNIYGTRTNRAYCKERGIRFGGKPLGRPKKQTEKNKQEILESKRQQRKDYLERIPIEGKFGQGKNRHGLERIRAKLKETSEAWIRSIFLVMNLRVLLRLFFARNRPAFYTIQRILGPLWPPSMVGVRSSLIRDPYVQRMACVRR
uniref:Transposase n=1 Tax=Magnetococcus massalia (strain MO-1) TaxID=451514 RepID=A0A1S7LKE2_MAGMO|nr:Transposase [Candidatus Magnetococcus massalia]CRH07375.1 Transposase [Candidatus Magnetococcus massalia]